MQNVNFKFYRVIFVHVPSKKEIVIKINSFQMFTNYNFKDNQFKKVFSIMRNTNVFLEYKLSFQELFLVPENA